MESEYIISEKEYVKANKLFTKLSREKCIGYIVVALVLLAVAYFAEPMIIKFASVGALLGGLIGHIITRHIYAPIRTKSLYRNYQAAQESTSIEVSSEAINFKSSIGNASLDWSHIIKWRESPDLVLIYQSPELYHIIPKRIGNTATELVQVLNQNVGNAT